MFKPNKYLGQSCRIFLLLCFSLQILAQNPDINLLRNINQNSTAFLRSYSTGISNSTTFVGISVPVVMGVAAVLTKDETMLKNSISAGMSLGVAALMTYGLKHTIGRPRPSVTWPKLITPYETIHSNSFPSGHTSFAFAAATSVSLSYRKWYVAVPAFLWAGSVGYSRMNLGVHYPSDVLAGAALGAGSAYLSHKLNEWFYPKVNPVKKLKLDGLFL